MMLFLRLSLDYMSRRKIRTVLTTVSIFFGVTVIFATWTAMPEAQRLIDEGSAFDSNASQADTVENMNLVTITLGAFGGIALFVGAFLIFNTFRTVIVERQHDFAMLRTIGAERRQIMQLILVEALVQGTFGTVFGLLAGWVFAWWMLVWIYSTGSVPSITFSPAPPGLNLPALLTASGLGLGSSFLAAYIPARRATRVSPLAALRPMTAEQDTRSSQRSLIIGGTGFMAGLVLLPGKDTTALGAVLVLGSAVLVMPPLIPLYLAWVMPLMRRLFPESADLAHYNILTQRGRAAATINSLMMALAVFIACASIVVALHDFFVRLYTFTFVTDYIVVDITNLPRLTNGSIDGKITLNAAVVERLRQDPAVTGMTGARVGSARYQEATLQLIGIEPQDAAELRPIYFAPGNGDFATVMQTLDSQRAVIVSSVVVKDFGVKIGDTIELTAPDGAAQPYKIAGIATDYLTVGGYGAILSQANLARDFDVDGDAILYLQVQPDAAMNHLRAHLTPNLLLINLATFRDETIAAGTNVVSVFYILAVMVILPALLGLVNTLTINVLERTREFGTLRALGGERGQIRQMVIMEVILLGIPGAVVGVIVGVGLGISILSLWGTTSVPTVGGLYFVFPSVAIAAGLVLGAIIVLLTSSLPARSAANLNIVDALRYE